MAAVQEVEIYTVPVTETDKVLYHELRGPYTRIIGAKSGTQKLWTPEEIDHDPFSRYDKADAERGSLRLPRAVADRFLRFFHTSMVHANSDDIPSFNCFSFGFSMLGEDLGIFEAEARANLIIEQGIEAGTRKIKIGQIGVLGYLDQERGGDAFHAVAGLGVRNQDCLQITGCDGRLAIAAYANVFRSYSQPHDTASPGLGLYVENT